MLIKNAKIRGIEGINDILIKDNIISEIAPNLNVNNTDVIDACRHLVLPPYVDSHCHLDYVGSSGNPRHNMSGTLFEGISILSDMAPLITYEKVKERAEKVLKWQIAHGTQYVRTHVNTDEIGLISLKALLDLKQQYQDYIDIQIVAFPQHGLYKFDHAFELIENALIMGADAIGAIPHFEDTREEAVLSLKKIFELAVKYDKLIDVHCDETDDDQSRSLEVVAKEAINYKLGSKVTASHTTAMGSYNNAYVFKLFSLLSRSNINIVSNPTINIHLQGRYDTYPKRRGLTRVKELLESGINVSMGTDDIMDPCYPLGSGNMLEVLWMGVHVCHLTGYQQLLDSFDCITVNGAKTLNIADYGIKVGNSANLLIMPTDDEYDTLRRMAEPLYSIRNGKIIMKREISNALIYCMQNEEAIDFSL